jgi:superfamily I DNA/RNA helicase
VQGADPRRMMLLTFSRRAAIEMTRRVERIAALRDLVRTLDFGRSGLSVATQLQSISISDSNNVRSATRYSIRVS